MAAPGPAPRGGPSSAANAFSVTLGMRTLTASVERAEVALDVAAPHLNDVGIVHGGVILALADQALAVVANFERAKALTTTVTLHFLSSARAGDQLVATAHPVRSGRSMSVFAVSVRRAEALIASGLGQALVVEPTPTSPSG